MNRRYSWLSASLAATLCFAFPAASALAQEQGTTVVPKSTTKKPRSTATGNVPGTGEKADGSGANALRPAQDIPPIEPDKAPPPPPVEAEAPAGEIDNAEADAGAGWEAAVEESGPRPLIGAEREQAIARVNTYFNEMDSLQGTFRQIDSDNKVATGRFYVKQPGKLRFDYAPPSPLKIVSDGAFLAIEDSDLKTIEKYPLKSTPFRLLLAENVDVARDANVLGVSRGGGELAIQLQDRKGGTGGAIKLVFETAPEFQLSEWVITDAQGLTTQVTLDNLAPGRKVASDFFKSKQQPFNPYR
ncbi:LolA family protein [Methyloligella solikamskensis]|uniref:Outer membrane lipoprotein carrier protein LolA n=1 Tax=Methyloligella solikamskensis TaxID=1177756 RepID=A0ABW3J6B9_9HYPH